MSDDIVTGLASLGMGISDATKKPDVPKPPSETARKAGLLAKQRAAQSQGLSSTIIAGRSRTPLALPGGRTGTAAA